MPLVVAALDADVLVPITACDFLLTAFDLGLYEPVVSNMVLDEVERTLSTDFPNLTDEAVRYRVDAMREALADQIATADPSVAPSGINAKDRHVVAAAITGEATMIVSNDRRFGNEAAAASTTLTVLTLDAFASTLWDASPDGVNAVVDALVAKRQRPPVTRAELIMALRPHLPNVVKALGEYRPRRSCKRRPRTRDRRSEPWLTARRDVSEMYQSEMHRPVSAGPAAVNDSGQSPR